MGEITWDHKRDKEKRVAYWKEEDKKYAYVFFVSFTFFLLMSIQKKGFAVEWPRLFHDDFVDPDEEMVEKQQKMGKEHPNEINRKFINRKRAGIGEWWGL